MTTPTRSARNAPRRAPRRRCAFTIVELLVVVAAIATLGALVFTAASHAVHASRAFKCSMGMRSAAFDFTVFADDALHGDRGADTRELRAGRFRLETFQESQYGIDEFWRWGEGQSIATPTADGDDPMRCAEVRGPLTLRRDAPCSQGALDPPQNVSFTFNARLHRAEIFRNNRPVAAPVHLTSAIKTEGDVPLLWDADGAQAAANDLSPVFSAPPADSVALYADGRYWFPAPRHGGRVNVAFIDGHVEATKNPLGEGWRWGFQPDVR